MQTEKKPWSRVSFIKAFMLVLAVLIGLQLVSMFAYQRNHWWEVLQRTAFVSSFETKGDVSNNTSSYLPGDGSGGTGKVQNIKTEANVNLHGTVKLKNDSALLQGTMKTRNDNTHFQRTMNTRHDNTHFQRTMNTRHDNTHLQGTMNTRHDNTQSRGTVNTRNDNTQSQGTVNTRNDNTQSQGTVNTRNDNTQSQGTVNTRNDNTQSRGTVNTRNDNTQSQGTVNTRNDNTQSQGTVNTRNDNTQSQGTVNTRNDNTQSQGTVNTRNDNTQLQENVKVQGTVRETPAEKNADTEDWKRFIFDPTSSTQKPYSKEKTISKEEECKNMKGGNFTLGPDKKCIPECTYPPKDLVGPLKTYHESPPMSDLEQRINWTLPGGRYIPRDCWTRYKVAIVVPYRNRPTQLNTFLLNMHHLLRRQTLDYGIYIVEQSGDTRFNRALLMNIGYAESIKQHDFNCFIFHDVDLIPEDDRNFYGCGENPRHLSAAIDKFNYRLPYGSIFGGVSQIPRKKFEAANGYSNKFFGWGGEDDDMWNRLKAAGFTINRYAMKIARYKMIRHTHEKTNKANPMRFKLLREGQQRFKNDGINSLKYKLLKLEKKKLYTLVTVDVNESEIMAS